MKHTDVSGASHGSVKSYLIGFVLSVILTAIPFWMVMTGAAEPKTLVVAISLFAVVQIVVHLVYFLHMNTKSEGGWNFVALVFTGLIIAIVVVGSLWIMYNLNVNMMAH
ncbi:cytochrome o ubiquinol oxidase subunit IV [Leminorella grimontii]|uniref:Cytochrome bo(3) ubiquinol oxidase subunit 4 n=1 Tax=Leminorella grimontii TaxID=82981 RepID=A0AAV5N6S4_9GAMM|nr:cytochrome o ubiquinol oxidase subunit IV [Leminorella grimontii]KFC94814.1 cytochrome O ubiquinol oxidase subunit IV [Leminorella grimontii ATCC 33999 = DSM 5078]GKX56558.1 cytochrome o ubiquinol oxidase subunit IV [Leminorella grimontii]GKX59842.1 cytochrome o ubiquinol oxidase subunit IV [Leminorella grimontii]VFS61638.1 Cytochrome o ubiquinol oxidase protein CyoD [Leminorella grimontii]